MSHLTIVPSRERFEELAEVGNVVPVFVDLVADDQTPASAFQKLDEGGYSFLFESAEQTEQSGRYSFLGFSPRLTIRSDDGSISVEENGRVEKTEAGGDPLSSLERIMSRFRFVAEPDLPRFAGGAVGFLGYDMARHFEKSVPPPPEDDLHLPEMIFMIMGLLVVFDHRYRRLKIVANVFLEDHETTAAAHAAAERRIQEALSKLASPVRLPLIDAQRTVSRQPIRSNITRENFEVAVEKAKEYIHAGDIFQFVPLQRFETDYTGDPLTLYRRLRFVNPSPYLFCMNLAEAFHWSADGRKCTCA